MSLSLNGLQAISVRLVTPWQGAWTADVDFDLATVPVVPSGPAVLTIADGAAPLIGFIDPIFSGQFATSGHARVVSGYGWSKNVNAQHFHNDGGVLSSAVISATALQVLEKAVQAIPSRLGVDYTRTQGPASRVLAGLDWYTDFTNTTIVGTRIPKPIDPTSVEVLTWDPLTQTAEIAADGVLQPGGVLVDSRFGTATIVDVEQTWNAGSGARAVTHCRSTPEALSKGSRLSSALESLIKETSGTTYMALRKYRVVLQSPASKRLTLQAVKIGGQFPDLIEISMWPGTAGLSCRPTPGQLALVGFIDGDPSNPVVLAFDSSNPIELSLDASTFVRVGSAAAAPVASAAHTVAALQAIVAALIAGGLTTPAGLAAQAALAVITPQIPTHKLLAD